MDVRRRSVLAAGAAGAAVALGRAGTASAAALGARHDHRDPDSLRALAAPIGLRDRHRGQPVRARHSRLRAASPATSSRP